MTRTLSGVKFETFLDLSLHNETGMRLAFDRGCLEIEMSPLPTHESPNRCLELMIDWIAEIRGFEVRSLGSTTFHREAPEQGAEPDSCFYIQSAAQLPLDLAEFDQEKHIPDLVVEIDITSPSIDKDSFYARIGVPELWRYQKSSVTILVLEAGRYVPQESRAIPGLSATTLTRLLAQGQRQLRSQWRDAVRAWARGEES
jgi:Uma2 family endonuclease